ncbi:MAG: hypothetical protein J0I06_23085 [Planctomycetes bacterium]|nr:hypothetical protein [Planctomycetota bacterium]
MTDVKDCPKCGLVNPPSAQRCDCGYDFISRSVEASYLGKRDPRAADLTSAETALVLLVPGLGAVLGFAARSQGRIRAGNKMIIASMLMIIMPLAIFATFVGCR